MSWRCLNSWHEALRGVPESACAKKMYLLSDVLSQKHIFRTRCCEAFHFVCCSWSGSLEERETEWKLFELKSTLLGRQDAPAV